MSLPVPQFHGVVKNGKAVFDKRPIFDRMLATLEGKRFLITVKEDRGRRSTKQNAWWWGVAIPEIAEHLGYDRHEHDALHYELVKVWAGTHRDEQSGLELPNKRSSGLTVDEFSDLMQWAVRFAAEKWGMFILLPSDVNTSKDTKPLIQRGRKSKGS